MSDGRPAPEGVSPLAGDDPRTIGGHRLLLRLGAGGMGAVYLGEDPTGGRVAIKVIRRELALDGAFRARFAGEVANARRVASFCTARVLDHGEDDGRPYMVTEYIDGVSLGDLIEGDGALAPPRVRGLAVGTAAALTAIHAVRLVHRDLKPANVLVSDTGPRVIDFGIARALDSDERHTQTGIIIGSPGWIAPEQVFDSAVGTAADVFAWGTLVAYAASGVHPYGDGNMLVLASRAQQRKHDLSEVPGDLRRLVHAALDPAPGARPSAEDLLVALVGTEDPESAAQGIIASEWAPIPAPLPPHPRVPPPRPAAPHMNAPHMNAPPMNAPPMNAPHMNAPPMNAPAPPTLATPITPAPRPAEPAPPPAAAPPWPRVAPPNAPPPDASTHSRVPPPAADTAGPDASPAAPDVAPPPLPRVLPLSAGAPPPPSAAPPSRPGPDGPAESRAAAATGTGEASGRGVRGVRRVPRVRGVRWAPLAQWVPLVQRVRRVRRVRQAEPTRQAPPGRRARPVQQVRQARAGQPAEPVRRARPRPRPQAVQQATQAPPVQQARPVRRVRRRIQGGTPWKRPPRNVVVLAATALSLGTAGTVWLVNGDDRPDTSIATVPDPCRLPSASTVASLVPDAQGARNERPAEIFEGGRTTGCVWSLSTRPWYDGQIVRARLSLKVSVLPGGAGEARTGPRFEQGRHDLSARHGALSQDTGLHGIGDGAFGFQGLARLDPVERGLAGAAIVGVRFRNVLIEVDLRSIQARRGGGSGTGPSGQLRAEPLGFTAVAASAQDVARQVVRALSLCTACRN